MNRTNVSNVLVIGSGAAGLRAAIAVYRSRSEAVVVGMRLRKDTHTVLAAGGINAALGTVVPEDCWQQHFADTLKEVYFLADPLAVEIMAREAPRAIEELIEYGCPFARTETSELDLRFFGAHKYRHTCYVGDYTGRAILYALADRTDSLGIPVHEDRYVSRLLVHDDRCFGAFTFDTHTRGSAPSTLQTLWCSRTGGTPACGAGAPAGATRTRAAWMFVPPRRATPTWHMPSTCAHRSSRRR